jgi:hypothetical protein
VLALRIAQPTRFFNPCAIKHSLDSFPCQVEAEAADDVSEQFEISVVPTFIMLRVSRAPSLRPSSSSFGVLNTVG